MKKNRILISLVLLLFLVFQANIAVSFARDFTPAFKSKPIHSHCRDGYGKDGERNPHCVTPTPTPDPNVPPVISNETASQPDDMSVAVTWNTNHPATSRVIYDTVSHSVLGLAPNYGYANSTAEDSGLVTSHSVQVNGLTSGTTYFFRSVSHGSPEAVSDEFSATTTGVSPPIFLRPNLDSLEQEWECFNSIIGPSPVHYTNVNEVSPDDASSFCRIGISNSANAGKRNIYTLEDTATAGNIINVSVVGRGRRDNADPGGIPVNLKLGLRNSSNSSTEFDNGTEFPLDTNWTDYTVSFGPTNPATGLAWTWADINDLEIFHRVGSIPVVFGERLIVTQVYLKIDHTP